MPDVPLSNRSAAWTLAGGALAVLACVAIAAARTGDGAAVGVAIVLERWIVGGLLSGAYVAAGFGFGRWLARRFGLDSWALAGSLGLGVMLTSSHLLGVLGLLGPDALGRTIAIGTVAAGLALLAPALRGRRRLVAPGIAWWCALPAVGVLACASAVAPGWLWMSEFSGYDVLSYHAALPQEWLANGRLWPVTHNVYSFLPGYGEAAFLHLASAAGAPGQPGGLATGGLLLESSALYAMQMLHALATLLAAWCVGDATRTLAVRVPGDVARARLAGTIAGALVIATPWAAVAGSLAYNEMFVVALGAGAVRVAADGHARPALRWTITAALVGAACGAKPTALFMLTPIVAAVLLWRELDEHAFRPRASAAAIARGAAIGAAVGLTSLSPWMVRNAIVAGNPVFPFAASLLGAGHWNDAQHERFARAHRNDDALGDRLALVFRRDADAPESWPARQTHRGLAHPQWALLFPMAAAALGVLIARPRSRAIALVLGAGLAAQLAAWFTLTHVQSRFLLPVLVSAAPIVGLACSGVRARWIGYAAVLAQSAASAALFLSERPDGRGASQAMRTLAIGTRAAVGPGATATPEVLRSLGPTAFVNSTLPAGAVLELLGSATPLYHTTLLRYRTTWDAWPIAGLEPAEWTRALHAAGATHALVSLSELRRLSASGYAPPGVDPEAATDWLERGSASGELRVLRAWPSGDVLVELRGGGA